MKEKKSTTSKVGSGVLSNIKSTFSNLVRKKSLSDTPSQSKIISTPKPRPSMKTRPSMKARPPMRFRPPSMRHTRDPLSGYPSKVRKPVSYTSQYQSQKLSPSSSSPSSSSPSSSSPSSSSPSSSYPPSALLSIKPTSSQKLPPSPSDSIPRVSVAPQRPTLDIYSETNNLLIKLITKVRELMNNYSTTNDSELKKLLNFLKKSDTKIEDALIEIDNTKQKTLEMSLLKFNNILEKNCSGWNAPKCAIAERFLIADLQKIYKILKLFKSNLSISDKKIKIQEFIDVFITNFKKIIDENIHPDLQIFYKDVNKIYNILYHKGGKKKKYRKKTVTSKKQKKEKRKKM